MNNSKSTRIIAIGVGVLVIGAALLFLVVRGNKGTDNKTNVSADAPTTTTTVPGAVNFPATTTQTPTAIAFTIPNGENSVDIQMDYFAGGGGYVKAGDLINIYTIAGKTCPGAVTKLIYSDVKVLEVLGSAPAASGQSESFALAMTPQDAERLIFNDSVNSLYFTLTTDTEAPVATTGITCSNAL